MLSTFLEIKEFVVTLTNSRAEFVQGDIEK